MKRYYLIAGVICLTIFCFGLKSLLAAEASFSWLPNSETYLAGYKIHCGMATKSYGKIVDVGKPTTVAGRVNGKVSGLTDDTTYFCAATAYGTSAQQSGYSTEVTFKTPPPPIAPPQDFKVVDVITTVSKIDRYGKVIANTTIARKSVASDTAEGTTKKRISNKELVTTTIVAVQ